MEVKPECGDLLIHEGIEVAACSSVNGFLHIQEQNRGAIRKYNFVERVPGNYVHGGK